MKIKTLTRIDSAWRWPAIAATLLLFTDLAARAQTAPPHIFSVTENSSTSLTVTYDGAPVAATLVGIGDHWTLTLPDAVHLGMGEGSFGSPSGAAIPEPGVVGLLGPWNNVFTSTTINNPNTTLVDVQSDSLTTQAFALGFKDNVAGIVGFDADLRPIELTFHDAGDGSTNRVPDQSTTAFLLLAPLVGLLAARRFQHS